MAEIEDLKIVGGSTYTVGNQDIIANEWEAGKTYVKGKSYVIREHRLYVCNVTHTSVEPFDATKWTEITIGDAIANNTTAIGSLSSLTTSDKSSLVGAVNSITTNDFTFTPDSSVTTTSVIASQNDKMCVLTMEVNFTGNANAWKEIGVVNKVPKVAHCTTACVNSSNGTYLGMVEVRQSDGKVRIYPTSNVSNGYGIFTLAYVIA